MQKQELTIFTKRDTIKPTKVDHVRHWLHTKENPRVPARGFLMCTKNAYPAICKCSNQLQMLRQTPKK